MLNIKWQGVDKMSQAFRSATSKIDRSIDAVVKNNAEAVKAKAKEKAPVDTSFMKNEITALHPKSGYSEVHSPAGYSGFVEKGTRFMSAQPFMEPALEEQRGKMEKDYQDAVRGVFK